MNRNLIAIILIVAAGGIYVTVTEGVLASAQQVKTMNDQYVAAIANANRLVAMRDEVLKEYNAISDADRARLDKMMPSTVDNIRLVIDLNALAASHGLSFKGLSASAAGGAGASGQAMASQNSPALNAPLGGGLQSNMIAAAPTLDTVTVSFSVTTTYQGFMALLQDLESNLRVMDLTHLNVTANNTGVYDFNLQFKTYWLRQNI